MDVSLQEAVAFLEGISWPAAIVVIVIIFGKAKLFDAFRVWLTGNTDINYATNKAILEHIQTANETNAKLNKIESNDLSHVEASLKQIEQYTSCLPSLLVKMDNVALGVEYVKAKLNGKTQ